jgi:hypothetical protein
MGNVWRYDGTSMKTQAETIADLSARCAGPDQFQNFDRGVRACLSVPKEALLKEEARQKRLRARRRARKLA